MSASAPKQTDSHAELRDAVRALCREYDSAYWQKVDEARGYPEAFVDALTKAGWLAALIPEEYGGSGRADRSVGDHGGDQPLAAATRARATARCTTWARCCATAPRRRSSSTCRRSPRGELRLQSMAVTEPTTGTDTTKIKTDGGEEGRPLRRQRPEGVDVARAAFRSDDPAGAHDAADRGEEEVRRHVDLHRRPARGDRARASPCGRSATWSTTRPTSCSSTTSRFPPRT